MNGRTTKQEGEGMGPSTSLLQQVLNIQDVATTEAMHTRTG